MMHQQLLVSAKLNSVTHGKTVVTLPLPLNHPHAMNSINNNEGDIYSQGREIIVISMIVSVAWEIFHFSVAQDHLWLARGIQTLL